MLLRATKQREDVSKAASKVFSIPLLCLCIFVVACTTYETYQSDFRYITPQFATLLNDNMTIRAADGSWELSSDDKPFKPARVHNGFLLTHYARSKKPIDRTDYRESLNMGSEDEIPHYDVLIDVEGIRRPFYGILAFMSVADTTNQTTQRVWRLSIPDHYIQNAKGGVVSYVYGRVTYKGKHSADQKYDSSMDHYYYPSVDRGAINWILYLSDYPLK